MRRVARVLGVVPMALYHHVADKEELVALMADAISAEMVVPDLPADWRGALRAISYRTRDVFLRHPWLVGAAPQRHHLTANGLRHVEQSAAAVAGLDVDEATAIRMVAAADDFVVGYAVRQFAGPPDPDEVERELARFQPQLDALLATGQFPHTADF